MRQILILLCSLLTGALSPAAWASSSSLMQMAQLNDAARYASIASKGAEIRATSDNLSFTVWWQPSGWKPSSGVIVALHGHDGYASAEATLWQPYAQASGHAVLALQWWFGGGEATTDYYRPDQMYPLISALLAEKGVKAGTVLFTGYSRGSANSYAVAALDRASTGRRQFGLVLSNAGGAQSDYPPNQSINAGAFGSKPFDGMKWAMYCGEKDVDPDINGCPAMRRASEWVQGYGASVLLFIDDPVGDHGGFMTNASNVQTALATYATVLAAANSPLPTCTLSASANPVAIGASARLTATCSPVPTAFQWTGGTCAGTSTAVCSPSPTARTTYTVAGSAGAGFGTAASLTLEVVDQAPPAVPGNLRAQAPDSASIQLNWSAATDNVGVTGYRVYRGETLVASPTTLSYTDSGLKPATAYGYSVAACDAAGNCSARSATATATTAALGNALSASEIECLFNWAEDAYPTLLLPRRAVTASSAPYAYRYYPTTRVYVGVSSTDNHVYFLDAGGTMSDLGLAAGWAVNAGCR